jgi:hypothetical protein
LDKIKLAGNFTERAKLKKGINDDTAASRLMESVAGLLI